MTGSTPADINPSAKARASAAMVSGLRPKARSPTTSLLPGTGTSSTGGAVDGDADGPEVMPDQGAAAPRECEPACRIHRMDGRVGGSGRIGRPMRRPQALHPATFLVDQNRRTRSPDGLPERCRQGRELIGRLDVAPKQDEAPGLCFGEEIAFRVLRARARRNCTRTRASANPDQS